MTIVQKNTLLIILTFSITIIATDIYLPSLPAMAIFFKSSSDALQLSILSYMVGGLLSPPIFGIASDHFGRRKTMLWGMAIFILGSLLCFYSFSLTGLLLGRFIQGFGSVVAPIVGWAAIQDYYPGKKGAKMMAWIGSIISLGPLLAPSLGGFIDTIWGWQGNFLLLFIFSLGLFILMIFNFKDLPSSFQKNKLCIVDFMKSYSVVIKNKKFMSYIMLSAFLMCGELCYLTIIPFFFQSNLHLTSNLIGINISITSFAYIIGTLLASRFVHYVGINKSILFGIFLSFLGAFTLLFLSFFQSSSIIYIIFAMGFYMGGSALIWGPSTSAALQLFTKQRGAASAVRSLTIHLSMGAGGLVGTVMNDFDLKPLAVFLVIMCFFSLLSFLLLGTLKYNSSPIKN